MGKTYKKELSFQAGEISPRFLGRSETVIYDKGLSEATNVFIDKRGGAFKRTGFEHIARFAGVQARVLTIQATKQLYYTIFIHDLEMVIVIPNGVNIVMPSPWTAAQLDEIHFIESPGGNVLYFTHPNVPVQKLVYDFGADTFTPLAAVSFTAAPPEWAGTNYPATGTHYQGRLWLAATPNQRQTIWASVSGSSEDFTITSGVDSSALQFVLQEFGRIEWMLGTKNLLVGAENAEHIITSNAGVITPSDFDIEKQSSYGSNNMQGIQVGEKVFYVTPDGRKLRAMSYEWQEDNWLSQDLTFVSEHITKSGGLYSAWSQHPDSLFVLALADGALAVLTYDRTAETIAWTRYVVPGLRIIDIATGRVDGANELIIVGERKAGQLEVEISRLDSEYLDSYVSINDPAGTNIITGLDHLEGETVRALVDGAVEPEQVVSGGQIITQRTGNVLHAGLAYVARIATLPQDDQKSQIRSFKKRWNKTWALLLESKQPIINGVRPPDRTPSTPMGDVEPDITGHYRTVNLGWDDFGIITIEQDLPVAMNVLAIYGEMGQETL